MKTIDNRRIRSAVMSAALSIGLGFVTHASAGAEGTYLIDLNAKTASYLGFVTATALNDAGQVVGYSTTTNGQPRAFITGPNGVGMTDLGTLVGDHSYATAINDAGEAVGSSYTANGVSRAFVTGSNGVGVMYLPTGGTYSNSNAISINDSGQVFGDFNMPGGSYFITGPNGVGMTDLGPLAGERSRTVDMNNAGQVVGTQDGFTGSSAFITGPNGAGVTGLGVLGQNYSSATGINDTGQVVGDSTTNDGSYHAFITGPNGVSMTDLGTLPGQNYSFAAGINDAGQVVGGSSYTFSVPYHAFVTGPNGVGMTDLNSLVRMPGGLVLSEAIAINNAGQVIAVAATIPEPESYALLLAGLVLTGVMVRRKQKADALEGALDL